MILSHRLTCAISYRIFYARPYRPRRIMAYANWVDKKNRFRRRTKVVAETRKISALRDSATSIYAVAQKYRPLLLPPALSLSFFFKAPSFFPFLFRILPPSSCPACAPVHQPPTSRRCVCVCVCNIAIAKRVIFLLWSDVADAIFAQRSRANIFLYFVDIAMSTQHLRRRRRRVLTSTYNRHVAMILYMNVIQKSGFGNDERKTQTVFRNQMIRTIPCINYKTEKEKINAPSKLPTSISALLFPSSSQTYLHT